MMAENKNMNNANLNGNLDLRAGEIVEVRSADEILATLDANGRLDAMPFMPEMLQYCGKRFRVYKRADKTCDNIKDWNLRRVRNAVHLTGVRCDGSAHGGCDASCLIFWREAWLKRVDSDVVSASEIRGNDDTFTAASTGSALSVASASTLETIQRATCKQSPCNSSEETVYSCQATDLREFTTHLPLWDFRQYYRDIRSGNLSRRVAIAKSDRILEVLLSSLEVVRALLILAFNKIQQFRRGVQYPHIEGSLSTTPTVELNLRPGEYVQVKSKEEVLATLDSRNRNRGLLFDVEMLRYCGEKYRVLKRVHQIVDERTGRMRKMKGPCLILEGVFCTSEYHRLCPRAIYSYWREAWLRRLE